MKHVKKNETTKLMGMDDLSEWMGRWWERKWNLLLSRRLDWLHLLNFILWFMIITMEIFNKKPRHFAVLLFRMLMNHKIHQYKYTTNMNASNASAECNNKEGAVVYAMPGILRSISRKTITFNKYSIRCLIQWNNVIFMLLWWIHIYIWKLENVSMCLRQCLHINNICARIKIIWYILYGEGKKKDRTKVKEAKNHAFSVLFFVVVVVCVFVCECT